MLPIGTQFENHVKRRLRNGEKLIGSWLQLCSPMSAEILARAEFDFLLIDMEHGSGDLSTLLSQLYAISGYTSTPIVRVPWNDFVFVKRVLDAGAHGIHVPYVNTAQEAWQAVRSVLYAPEGIRGFAGSPRVCGYGVSGKDYYEHANREVLLYIALETSASIENLGEIMQVDGVDGIFIGPMDLATSMGYLGNPGHPEVQRAIREIERQVIGSGKFLGTIAGSYEAARELFDRGYQYVAAMSDSTELAKQSYRMMEQFHCDYPAV